MVQEAGGRAKPSKRECSNISRGDGECAERGQNNQCDDPPGHGEESALVFSDVLLPTSEFANNCVHADFPKELLSGDILPVAKSDVQCGMELFQSTGISSNHKYRAADRIYGGCGVQHGGWAHSQISQ